MENNQHLNLARKWRPQTFDQVVSQDVAIKILKNSLYIKKYFPVYLFAGQRGCGKTTTARIFAAALNCQALQTFQENPTIAAFPCLTCSSCSAMQNGNHSDFIEIDAASHTGVDNVRQIIETASYSPLLGSKKIYLIDEAHMLSKAAFNALLKILEEPPMTVHFILATTELQKIPQTVLSRCFQLTFNALKQESLKQHLITLCTEEKIQIDHEALNLIISETQGSARDALNLLEQVRFSTSHVTQETILKVLGKISALEIIQLFSHLINNKPEQLLETLIVVSQQHILPSALWDMIIELCRSILWVKHGITTLPASLSPYFDDIFTLASTCSLERLHAIMQFLWEQEPLFMQTNQKMILLEHTLLQLCYSGTPRLDQSTPLQKPQIPQATTIKKEDSVTFQRQVATPEKATQRTLPVEIIQPVTTNNPQWAGFIQEIQNFQDQLLKSILIQANFINFDEDKGAITLQLSNNGSFLKDKINDSKPLLKQLLINNFPTFKEFLFQPSQNIQPLPPLPPSSKPQSQFVPTNPPPAPSSSPSDYKKYPQKGGSSYKSQSQQQPQEQIITINIADKERWPLANLIISHFPGKITKDKTIN